MANELIFPPNARVSSERIDALANTAGSRSVFTGALRTVDRTGDRWRWGISTANASNRETYSTKAALQALRMQARGMSARIWFADPAYVQRGSFPSQELLSNNTFANGTTGWSAGSDAVLSANDRVLRVVRKSVIGANAYATQTPTLTRYAPHVFRFAVTANKGQNPYATFSVSSGNASGAFGSNLGIGKTGITTAWFVPNITGNPIFLDNNVASGTLAGDYFEVPYASCSRCALIDNGSNLLLHSHAIDNAAWSKSGLLTVTADSAFGPDRVVNAEIITEDTSTGSHFITQSVVRASADEDLEAHGVFGRNNGTRNVRLFVGSDGSNGGACVFDLGAGTAGTPINAGTGTNARGFIQDLGNGYFYCSVIARCAASSAAHFFAEMASGTSVSYTGDGTSSLIVSGLGLARSSVPVRVTQTTSTALPSGTSQAGKDFYTKGWPASTTGLLLPGDRVQIGNQLNMVVAPVNSDAAGLAYLQLAYPLRSAPADNAPIIINNPMARCVMPSNEGGWDAMPGGLSSFEMVLEEALDS